MKKPLEYLALSLYPWKFQTKRNFTSWNLQKLCYTPWKFEGQKPRPTEFHMIFSWSPLGFPHSIFSILHFYAEWRQTINLFYLLFYITSIVIVNWHQNSILHIDRTSWNCNITRLIHITCTISSAIAIRPFFFFLFEKYALKNIAIHVTCIFYWKYHHT